jgi:hypothetical protein
MRSPTERFVDLLAELLPQMTDVQRVRMEDAFNDAVEALEAQAQRREAESRSEEW